MPKGTLFPSLSFPATHDHSRMRMITQSRGTCFFCGTHVSKAARHVAPHVSGALELGHPLISILYLRERMSHPRNDLSCAESVR